MPYYSAPTERPRQPKRFLTVREVEDLAAAGQAEIVQDDDLMITDAAREVAHDLGVRITKPAQPLSPAPARASPVAIAPQAVQLAEQRLLHTSTELPVFSSQSGGSDPLVRALVDAVRANLKLVSTARKE